MIVRYTKKSAVVAPETTTPSTQTSDSTNSNNTSATKPLTTGNVYSSAGFSFVPVADYKVETSSSAATWRSNTQVPGTLLALVTIPQSFQPQTNFGDARFTIGMSSNAQAIQECDTESNGERAKGTVIINGVTFTRFTLTEAAAGNYYDTTGYRTLRNNTCYAVEYTIHSTNLRNYDPKMGIKEFNTQMVTAALENMAQSFKFK